MADMLTLCYDALGNLLWSRTWNNFGMNEVANKISVRGNIAVVTGGTQVGLTEWQMALVKYNASNGFEYGSYIYGGSGAGVDQINDFAVDAQNNYYLTGMVNNQGTNEDIVVLKLDQNLNLLWSQNLDGGYNLNDAGNGLALDASGNVYIIGTSQLGGTRSAFQIAKYSNSGNLLWHKTEQYHPESRDQGKDIAISGTSIVLTGTSNLIGNEDIITMRIDQSGNQIWSTLFNDLRNHNNRAAHIAFDNNGDIIVNGTSEINGDYVNLNIKYSEEELYTDLGSSYNSKGSSIIKNNGQLLDIDGNPAPQVIGYSNQLPYSIYFLDGQISYSYRVKTGNPENPFEINRLDMTFSPNIESINNEEPILIGQRSSFTNYYYDHIPEGRVRVPEYDQVYYPEAAPGMDVSVALMGKSPTYHFVLKPGGAAKTSIPLYFNGSTDISTDEGFAIVATDLGNVIIPGGTAYQLDANGNSIPLSWDPDYNADGSTLHINLGSYNPALTLVLEMGAPESTSQTFDGMCWGTYFGGNSDEQTMALTVNDNEDHYICGYTLSLGSIFPLRNPVEWINTGKTNFMSKFRGNSGPGMIKNQLMWSTFYGSGSTNVAWDIKTNSTGAVYVCGETNGINTWNQSGAYNDPTYNGTIPSGIDAYIVKFNPNAGTIDWATYFGGPDKDAFLSMAFDSQDRLYIGGYGEGGSYYTPLSGAFDQSYISGNGLDGMLARFDANDQLEWATFYGGNGRDKIVSIDIDDNDRLAIAGLTQSSNMPLRDADQSSSADYFKNSLGGNLDVFVATFDANGAHQWGTYFGGSDSDWDIEGGSKNILSFDPQNRLYMVGSTWSDNVTEGFPIQFWGVSGYSYNDNTYAAMARNTGFIARFGTNYSLEWCSYVGADGGLQLNAIDISTDGKIFVGGSTGDAALAYRPSGSAPLYSQTGLKNATYALWGTDDAFIMALDNQHGEMWSTPFGGETGFSTTQGEEIYDLEVFENQTVYITGYTSADGGVNAVASDRFPTFDYNVASQDDYFVDTHQGMFWDGFANSFCVQELIYTSLDEISSSGFGLRLYPNPTQGIFFLESDEVVDRIQLLDITGRVLEQYTNVPQGTTEMDLNSYPNGVYLVKVTVGNKEVQQRVIQH